MKKIIVFAIMMVTLGVMCHAQRVPSWMNELPKAGNSTYVYLRETGEGTSYTAALNQALARVMQSTANRIGQPFDSQQINAALQSGTNYEVISSQYNIPINKVDEYDVRLKDGSHRVYVLCQVAASGNVRPQWESLERAGESNNWTALAKSAVIPGLGQMGKGYYGEGIVMLAGEAALVGTGLGCYFIAKNDLDIMKNYSTSYTDFAAARKEYNTLHTTSRIVWTAAGVLYAYNLVRAFTMQPKSTDRFVMEPLLMSAPQGLTPALGLTWRF